MGAVIKVCVLVSMGFGYFTYVSTHFHKNDVENVTKLVIP